MNPYLKIFLTIVILIAARSLDSLAYYFLRMADSVFNIGGALLITASSLGAFWCLHQIFIKPIPKDDKLFEEKEKTNNNSR